MSVRNVVKVMNFHALIRVDNARKKADKYRMMEEKLFSIMDAILNNRNFILDQKIFKVNEEAPAITIYIGSDFGFCSNYNSQIYERLSKDKTSSKIVIGRKLKRGQTERAEYYTTAGELEEKLPEICGYLEEQIREQKCSSIHIVYNHYENTTTICSRNTRIYPVEGMRRREDVYTEDFAIEGDINEIMLNLMAAYVNYELRLATVNSRAAENVLRQNATTESLKKIDEMEAEKGLAERRERRGEEFRKVIDNYIKKSVY